jgi:glucuronosyltransferase
MNFGVMMYVKLIIPGLVIMTMTHSFEILGVFTHIGKSHFDVFEPYLEQLAARGHQLTVISHFPPKNPIPSYKNIDLRGTATVNKTVNIISYMVIPQMGQITSALLLSQWGTEACQKTLEHPNVQELIKSDEKFDLLITEMFNTDCFLAFAHKFKIPIIGFSSCVFMPWTPGRVGNPDNPAYIPTQFVFSSDKMTFSERFLNTFWYVFHHLHYPLLMDAPAHKLARQHFGESLPALSHLARNTSLIFVNNHFSLNRPRPLVPGIIEVAGIHMKPAKALPKVRSLLHRGGFLTVFTSAIIILTITFVSEIPRLERRMF